jgi:hypothetical protein
LPQPSAGRSPPSRRHRRPGSASQRAVCDDPYNDQEQAAREAGLQARLWVCVGEQARRIASIAQLDRRNRLAVAPCVVPRPETWPSTIRFTEDELAIIRSTAQKHFGVGSAIWLYGIHAGTPETLAVVRRLQVAASRLVGNGEAP